MFLRRWLSLPSVAAVFVGGGDGTPGGAVDVLTDDDTVSALLDDDGVTFLTDD